MFCDCDWQGDASKPEHVLGRGETDASDVDAGDGDADAVAEVRHRGGVVVCARVHVLRDDGYAQEVVGRLRDQHRRSLPRLQSCLRKYSFTVCQQSQLRFANYITNTITE